MRPGARELVHWALEHGDHLAIATDPVFPREATLERIRWAGLEPRQFELVSTFETFHFTKDHPAFFAEFMGRLGWPDRPALMAGNDMKRDLEPAAVVGLAGFHVEPDGTNLPEPYFPGSESTTAVPRGSLTALRAMLQAGSFADPVRAPTMRESVMALLQATPAALDGLTRDLSAETWKVEPSREDWALVELVCHLRDTEREVHHAQIAALVGEADPFVPRPDAAVWAKQRKYLDEDGPAAVLDFARARIETLRRLESLPAAIWAKGARHAIFGPTTFLEVATFMADHDRMHLQQASRTLALLGNSAHRTL